VITFGGMAAMSEGNMGSRQRTLQTITTSLLIWLPVLIYEIHVAVSGTPVVFSGNCMLVELNPKWGFLDSEIETYWKQGWTVPGGSGPGPRPIGPA
jgi:hypothetical protein